METIPEAEEGLLRGQYVPLDGKHAIHWLTSKPFSDQEQAAKDLFQELLQAASRPRHASGNACVKLCYFVEQCSKSGSFLLQNMACSYGTCLSLFSFYVEWNEKHQHRSMKQVLELLAALISRNPDSSVAQRIKIEVLHRLVSNITHESAQSFVKPTLKVLECFLSKGTVSVTELLATYSESKFFKGSSGLHDQRSTRLIPSDSFVSAIFDWMSSPDTAPGAGKLLVTFLQVFKKDSLASALDNSGIHTALWQRWVRFGLAEHPECLENVKNYLLPAFFKTDREASLDFLRHLAQETDFIHLENQELDSQAFLLLSAMEAGKKSGLVDEPSISIQRDSAKVRDFILLPQDTIGALLSHNLSRVRSTAFSVLVTSISSIRPFPTCTLDILKQKLGILHADPDAKFRNEVLSNSKHMVERLRGATSSLAREIAINNSSLKKDSSAEVGYIQSAKEAMHMLHISLQEHKNFMGWYLQFLSDELVSTASYQRHITALRAIQILIRSDAFESRTEDGLMISPSTQSVWTFNICIFTKKTIRLLLDRLLDPFEDVRAAATEILKSAALGSFLDQKLHCSMSRSFDRFIARPESSIIGRNSHIFYQEGDKEYNFDESWTYEIPKFLLQFKELIQDASQRTGRADLADGVARTSELLCTFLLTDVSRLKFLESLVSDLEKKVAVAEEDLATAVSFVPIHGQFASVRLVWDLLSQPINRANMSGNQSKHPEEVSLSSLSRKSDWENIQYRMIRCCARIWSAVEDVLCNDSPEGHLPNDVDESDTLDTKDILSYSFRAIHESSNLLAVIVSKVKLRLADGPPILPFHAFQEAGDLTFQQLANLRHRGAFSTVSLTFTKCCQLTQESSLKGLGGANLLLKWYHGTLICIQNQVSTTRRSAGIPALITGILSANSSSLELEEVMSELKALARQPVLLSDKDEISLPQVHAINCLKEIFKSSTLGKRSEGHIPDCLQLAATSLKSKIWAIRNCGLLLLRSLIDCLFGTSESKTVTESGWDGRSTRLAYASYPALPQLLLDLITPNLEKQVIGGNCDIGAVESVFPALDIIRRAGPPKLLREDIFHGVKAHLGSEMWHVREIAARTMCTMLLHDRWLPELIDLLNTCGTSGNEIHGFLLTTKYLLERMLEVNPGALFEKLSALSKKIKEFWEMKQSCHEINTLLEAAYEDLATAVLKILYISLEKLRKYPQNHENSNGSMVLLDEDIFNRATKILREDGKNVQASESVDSRNMIAPETNSVLLVNALAFRAIYTAAISGQINRLKDLVEVAIKHDTDTACAMLGHMQVLWNRQGSVTDLVALFDIYQMVLSTSSVNHIRSSALHNLTVLLDHFSKPDKPGIFFPDLGFLGLDVSLPSSGSPELSAAEISVTGSFILYHLVLQTRSDNLRMPSEQLKEQIKAWGFMLTAVGKSENDFDIRLAAVKALRSFWTGHWKSKSAFQKHEFLLPSLLSLYDILNDDDDEIREAGANIVSMIVGTSLVPLAASEIFLTWIHKAFGENEAFHKVVLERIVGFYDTRNEIPLPVENQLTEAMEKDDSLFIEEEQNLYADQVREVIAWTSLLTNSSGPQWDKVVENLSSWAVKGLDILSQLAKTEDGPYGWTSKPKVFEICMRIILTAKAVLARQGSPSLSAENSAVVYGGKDTTNKEIGNVVQPLRLAVARLHDIGCTTNLHPVLLDHLEDKKMLPTTFSKHNIVNTLMPKI